MAGSLPQFVGFWKRSGPGDSCDRGSEEDKVRMLCSSRASLDRISRGLKGGVFLPGPGAFGSVSRRISSLAAGSPFSCLMVST